MQQTLIFGSGRDAIQIAEELTSQGISVILATAGQRETDSPAMDIDVNKKHFFETLFFDRCLSCKTTAQGYVLRFLSASDILSRTVSRIVFSGDLRRKPNFKRYGLTPSRHVIDLSAMTAALENGLDTEVTMKSAQRIVFIDGLFAESHPVITGEVMTAALKLQEEYGKQIYIMTGNLKVAANGLEALYRKTKSAGVIYFKGTESVPDMAETGTGRIVITVVDEIMGETCRLEPDILVVDETLSPPDWMVALAGTLELEIGPDGFLQSDNVHRTVIETNRMGVFASGFSRAIQTPEARKTDIGYVGLSHQRSLQNAVATDARAKIETSRCVKCLTCFRICPYRAVALNTRPEVVSSACEGCGLCAAECPGSAIVLEFSAERDIRARIPEFQPNPGGPPFEPSLVAFACKRSAAAAGALARQMGIPLPPGLRLIEVPCGGSVSLDYLLTAFKKGADGVLVLTCHSGNCHSGNGNKYACQRVDEIRRLLVQTGFESQRLAYHTLASNMGVDYADIVTAFEKQIAELGPSRLQGQRR